MHNPKELDRGYAECSNCPSGIKLLQAGFEVETHVCSVCREEVADREEFFLTTGARMLAK